ncbi:DUF924 domain-containing protein [Agrobacterium sp. a22-2]|uniref:DUF924 family protein n=1 Tax=Agrobacterium sp. a22-2 TaxID=2283840 RepID=UPI0014475E7B|nr:DUF924 family protein [Agrobacterium sp. a22-2]NKN37096.1 DUF924 domain-containing protein [Agrobacterium sp. a22-2]
MTTPAEIVAFWLRHGPKKWFGKDDAFDAEIAALFATDHVAASRGDYPEWEATAEGTLALLLLLDQFPRNLYRGSAHSYATDGLARSIAAKALDAGFDRAVEPALRPFFYLPFEHSETLADQERCMALCRAHCDETGDTESLRWAEEHHDIIARFGRFPHRNKALGRQTTPEEQAFLDAGGFKG